MMNSDVSGGAVSGSFIESFEENTASPSSTSSVVINDHGGEDSRMSSSPSPVCTADVGSVPFSYVASGSSVYVENLEYIERSIRFWNGAGILFIALLLCFLFYKFLNIFF